MMNGRNGHWGDIGLVDEVRFVVSTMEVVTTREASVRKWVQRGRACSSGSNTVQSAIPASEKSKRVVRSVVIT